MLLTTLPEKIRTFIFGKKTEAPFDTDKLGMTVIESMHKRAEDARRQEIEGYLKAHYENDLLPVMREWFKPLDAPIADRPLEYSLLSASTYYHPQGKSVVSELSKPKHFPQNIVEEVVEHLSKGYPEDWDKWVGLKDRVNSHLRSVVRTWEKIEENVKVIAEELGLTEWDGKGLRPTDYCWVNRLVEAIWIDPEYYQHQKIHIWDDYEIHPERGGFEFGGIWASAQKRETLEELKGRLTSESSKITGVKSKFGEEKSNLESDGKAFKSFLKTIEDDYMRRHKGISSSCPTCEAWLVERAKLGA